MPDRCFVWCARPSTVRLPGWSLGLQLAQKRLLPFEQKYGVTSTQFAAEMTAEDLAGGDDEYVRWAGEYRLMERLQAKLQRLQEVEYSDPELFQLNQISG